MTLHNEALDFFAIGIINLRKLRSLANALQEGCFTSIRSADEKDSETIDAIELLLDFLWIQMNCLGHGLDTWGIVFDTRGVVWHHVYTLIDDDQDRSLTTTHSFS